MKLRQSITIAADPAGVWPYLIDPVLQAAWNPKIVSIDRDVDGPVEIGDRFTMLYRMSGKDNLSQVEVTQVVPNERLVFQHRLALDKGEQQAEEIFELTPERNGTALTHTINLSDTGIPLPFRILIWLIMRFGKDVGPKYLETLKQMIESEIASPSNGEL